MTSAGRLKSIQFNHSAGAFFKGQKTTLIQLSSRPRVSFKEAFALGSYHTMRNGYGKVLTISASECDYWRQGHQRGNEVKMQQLEPQRNTTGVLTHRGNVRPVTQREDHKTTQKEEDPLHARA